MRADVDSTYCRFHDDGFDGCWRLNGRLSHSEVCGGESLAMEERRAEWSWRGTESQSEDRETHYLTFLFIYPATPFSSSRLKCSTRWFYLGLDLGFETLAACMDCSSFNGS